MLLYQKKIQTHSVFTKKGRWTMYEGLVPRFMKYVKINTRSDASSTTTPSTQSQVDFAKNVLMPELEEIGLKDIHYNTDNGYVIATLPANTDKKDARSIGFLAHMDTADFNADGVNPQLVENYDGHSDIELGTSGYRLSVKEFPHLANYQGQDLITTDGTTLLGADDKSGIAEIMTAITYLTKHPEIKHGKVMVGFGPDEEIGIGADKFDVKDFDVDFAYTIDGGPLGELEYETFNAAAARLTFIGKNVHPGTAKDTMVNALKLAIEFNSYLPALEAPEHTEGYEGFYHLLSMDGNEEEAHSEYIIRDHDKAKFEERKHMIEFIAKRMNEMYGQERVKVEMNDQYYNMGEVIEKDMSIIDLARDAMEKVGVAPDVQPVRGGTDGSKISFMGIPTPNIFTGGENMHGRFEFISIQTMQKAVSTIIEIVKLNEERA